MDIKDTQLFKSNNLVRCSWCVGNHNYEKYHDEEWGFPVHDDIKHFEFLLLETMQAGLSWLTILNKRENFRAAFANFNPQLVADFGQNELDQLMQNTGIIRNKLKLAAAIHNAKCFLAIQAKYGSFDKYIWHFSLGKVIKGSWHDIKQIKPTSELSDIIAKDLKKHGFKFVGSTTTYAHLQAIGIINDHITSCFRY